MLALASPLGLDKHRVAAKRVWVARGLHKMRLVRMAARMAVAGRVQMLALEVLLLLLVRLVLLKRVLVRMVQLVGWVHLEAARRGRLLLLLLLLRRRRRSVS